MSPCHPGMSGCHPGMSGCHPGMSGCHPDDIQTSPDIEVLGFWSWCPVWCLNGGGLLGHETSGGLGMKGGLGAWLVVPSKNAAKNQEIAHFCGGLSKNAIVDICRVLPRWFSLQKLLGGILYNAEGRPFLESQHESTFSMSFGLDQTSPGWMMKSSGGAIGWGGWGVP